MRAVFDRWTLYLSAGQAAPALGLAATGLELATIAAAAIAARLAACALCLAVNAAGLTQEWKQLGSWQAKAKQCGA